MAEPQGTPGTPGNPGDHRDHETPRARGAGPIRSDLCGEADMIDLIRSFVDELPERVDALLAAWEHGELESVKQLAQQLKGSSVGHGFGQVGESAAKLESLLKTGECDPATLRPRIDELLDLCGRASL